MKNIHRCADLSILSLDIPSKPLAWFKVDCLFFFILNYFNLALELDIYKSQYK